MSACGDPGCHGGCTPPAPRVAHDRRAWEALSGQAQRNVETFDDAFARELRYGRQRDEFMEEVRRELFRAREKHPGEEGMLTDAEWLAVLTEEVGEVARAIQDEGDDALRLELAQVAAVAVRWALSIPQGRVRPPWSPSGPRA